MIRIIWQLQLSAQNWNYMIVKKDLLGNEHFRNIAVAVTAPSFLTLSNVLYCCV